MPPKLIGDLVAKSCLTLATPWTVACQAPLSMGFSRQEYWSGLPFPSPGDLSHPGIEPRSPTLHADFFFYQFSYKGSPPKLIRALKIGFQTGVPSKKEIPDHFCLKPSRTYSIQHCFKHMACSANICQ